MIGTMRLADVAEQLDGRLQGADIEFDTVSIDTRKLPAGSLFVAIVGAKFDGNDFVEEAARQGASSAIVSRLANVAIPQLKVGDTSAALGVLGKINRDRSGARIIGITGSQGKTTVKEMIGKILARQGSTLVTSGNLNNAIGVPLTLLRLNDTHRFGVIEMGANHAGEIAYSSGLVRPDVAVLTNAAHAHIEGFGSLAGVVKAKGEIIDSLGPSGTMVLNGDDPHFEVWKQRAGVRRVARFSLTDRSADYYAEEIIRGGDSGQSFRIHARGHQIDITLKLLGRHNVANALAASAAAMEGGAEPEAVSEGLADLQPVSGRMCLCPNRLGIRLIDDSYNASPDSFKVAVDVLASFAGRRILVVGDMAELGALTGDAHKELGIYARDSGIEELWSVGDSSGLSARAFGQGGRQFPSKDAVVEHCLKELGPGVTLLVKGSRSAGMDVIVQALAANSD